MPFTIAQLTAFWTSPAQMGLTAHTCVQMAAEGSATPDNFEDFPEKDDHEGLFKQLVKPAKTPGLGANALHTGSINVCYPCKVNDSPAWGANNCDLLQDGGTHN